MRGKPIKLADPAAANERKDSMWKRGVSDL